MKQYAAQRAQQAFQELIKEAPLDERLTNARLHLDFADNEHFVEDAHEVREALREMENAFDHGDQDAKANAIRHAIEAIFEEYGAMKRSSA